MRDHGGNLDSAAALFGGAVEDWLDLSTGINRVPYPMPRLPARALTALPEINTKFVVVPRLRGQQLKDQAQLDGWLRDGSAAYVEGLCEWE